MLVVMYMMIVVSPAKRMRSSIDYMDVESTVLFMEKSKQLAGWLQTKTPNELKKMLKCSDAIALWTYHSYQHMELEDKQAQVPALLAFDGIQYTYMAADLFTDEYFAYARRHVRILSALYGVLRPFDGVVPYRLELDTPFVTPFCKSLYDFWGECILASIAQEDRVILDLTSKQYGRILKRYRDASIRLVQVYFYEEEQGIRKEKGVYVKMARGEMVRWLAEEKIEDVEDVRKFQRLGYTFDEASSTEDAYVFVRPKNWKQRLLHKEENG